VNFEIEFEQEEGGRWIAEISELPGVMAYGATRLGMREMGHPGCGTPARRVRASV
jgi:predicted RNase H-like HicB family nuclease